jgi:hypothetical protein
MVRPAIWSARLAAIAFAAISTVHGGCRAAEIQVPGLLSALRPMLPHRLTQRRRHPRRRRRVDTELSDPLRVRRRRSAT